jgi:hypothetical protein
MKPDVRPSFHAVRRWTLAASAAGIIAGVGILAPHRATGQSCNYVTPQTFTLQLLSVTIDGITGDLGTNECDNTATEAKVWYTPRRLYPYDLELLTVRTGDGGTVDPNPPCQGIPLLGEDLGLDLVTDGGVQHD